MRAIASGTQGATDSGRFSLRCDNEPSIVALAEKVQAKMPDTVVVESTPRHSSASNGLAQRQPGHLANTENPSR